MHQKFSKLPFPWNVFDATHSHQKIESRKLIYLDHLVQKVFKYIEMSEVSVLSTRSCVFHRKRGTAFALSNSRERMIEHKLYDQCRS